VAQIIEQNKNGLKPATLEKDAEEQLPAGPLNTDLAQLDKKYRNKSRGKKRKNKPGRNRGPVQPSRQQPNNPGQ